MKQFRTLTKKVKPKKFSLPTGNKIKATRKSSQINLLTGKPIKRKPKTVPKKVEVVIDKPIINTIPSELIAIINTFPKDLQIFLTDANILSVKNTAGIVIFKLEDKIEVVVSDTTVNSKPKKLVIIKQGKKQILKHII